MDFIKEISLDSHKDEHKYLLVKHQIRKIIRNNNSNKYNNNNKNKKNNKKFNIIYY